MSPDLCKQTRISLRTELFWALNTDAAITAHEHERISSIFFARGLRYDEKSVWYTADDDDDDNEDDRDGNDTRIFRAKRSTSK